MSSFHFTNRPEVNVVNMSSFRYLGDETSSSMPTKVNSISKLFFSFIATVGFVFLTVYAFSSLRHNTNEGGWVFVGLGSMLASGFSGFGVIRYGRALAARIKYDKALNKASSVKEPTASTTLL